MDQEEEYEEYNEEISINDYHIITNYDGWEPSKQQVHAYAEKLELELNEENYYLYDILVKYMTGELPPEWKRAFHKESGELLYINQSTNEVQDITDIEDNVLIELQKAYDEHQRKQRQKGQVNTQKKTKSNSKHKRDKDYINPNDDRSNKVLEGSAVKSTTIPKWGETPLKEEFEVFSNTNTNNKNNIAITDVKHIESDNSNNDNDKQESSSSPQPQIVTANKMKSSTLLELKQEHEYHKIAELKDYKQFLKSNYKNEYQKIKQDCLENYEKQLIMKKRELRGQLDKRNNDSLYEYENGLEAIKDNEISSYTELKENSKEITNQHEEDNDRMAKANNDTVINELKAKRDKVIMLIEKQKEIEKSKEKQMIDQRKEKLIQAKKALEERTKQQKDSISKKTQKDIEDIEMEFNRKTQKERTAMNKSIRVEKAKIKSIDSAISAIQPILASFQSTLDEEHKLKCNLIDEEFEQQKQIDLDDFIEKGHKEANEKIALINKDSDILEANYYTELNSMRLITSQFHNKQREDIKKFLIELSLSFNTLKTKLLNQMDTQMNELITLIQESIVSSQSDEAIAMIESKSEESIMLKETEIQIAYQKAKSIYELTEKEYMQKERLLRYFIAISSALTKKLVENPMIDSSNRDIVDLIIDEMMSIGKSKLSEYSIKHGIMDNRSSKQRSLFSFVDSFDIGHMIGVKSRSDLSNSNRENVDVPNDNYNVSIGINNAQIITQRQGNSGNGNNTSYRYYKQDVKSNRDKEILKSLEYTQPEKELEREVNRPDVLLQSKQEYTPKKTIDHKPFLIYSYTNNQSPHQEHQSQHKQPITLSLPNDIISRLPTEEFNLYSRIKDFIMDETVSLDKDYSIVNEQANITNHLTQINKSGYLDKYNQALSEERTKGIRIDQRYRNKYDLFTIIRSNISEVFNFIISNHHRKEVFIEKLKLLTKHIEDYHDYIMQCNKEYSNESNLMRQSANKTFREKDRNTLNNINRFSLSLAINDRSNYFK